MSYMTCDVCDTSGYTEENPFVEYRTQRPSDHSDMCCTMAGHAKCFNIKDIKTLPQISDVDGIATREQWSKWIESNEAQKAGFCFLT